MREQNIVFYGDSNTYGYTPLGQRYDERFTKIIDSILGEKYHISEEGVVGRTTIYPDKREGRCGIRDLDFVLGKYKKIDYLVIMLGTNDFKIANARTVEDFTNAMSLLLTKINSLHNTNTILLVSPILLSERIEELDAEFDYTSFLLSQAASSAYGELAKKFNTLFFDAKTVANAGSDGEHFTQEAHYSLAKALAKIIYTKGK